MCGWFARPGRPEGRGVLRTHDQGEQERAGSEVWVLLYWDLRPGGHLEGELREETWMRGGGCLLTREEGRVRT